MDDPILKILICDLLVKEIVGWEWSFIVEDMSNVICEGDGRPPGESDRWNFRFFLFFILFLHDVDDQILKILVSDLPIKERFNWEWLFQMENLWTVWFKKVMVKFRNPYGLKSYFLKSFLIYICYLKLIFL